MSMMHSQTNRAIITAIAERAIPEIQNIVSSMSSSGNRDTEASWSRDSQENNEGFKSKITKRTRGLLVTLETTGTVVLTHTLDRILSRVWSAWNPKLLWSLV